IARAHGIAAWVATALLVATAWAVVRWPTRRRIGIWMGAGAILSSALAGALGLLLDDAYRSRLRQRLFVEAPALGWLFERKEHLAFGAVLLGWSAFWSLGAAWLVARAPRRGDGRYGRASTLSNDLGRAATVGWAAAALLSLAASIASAIVARRT